MHIAHLLPVEGNLLICGPNWLGDSVMCMPALQALRRRRPSCRLTMLVKPRLEPLWRMHSAIDGVAGLNVGPVSTFRTAAALRARAFDAALVFPNSFRSALIPFLARIPVRAGMAGHGRAWMLTHVIDPPTEPAQYHQLWEYIEIAGVADGPGEPDVPRLTVPPPLQEAARERLALAKGQPWIGLIPGAARGPSKQWPPERFVETGRALAATAKCRLLILGTRGEVALCRQVAEGIGSGALSVAGETSLAEFAALLGACRVVVTNDSGGMHVAAAVGSRVVAVFGLTDPRKTGPIGTGHRVICREGVEGARDIDRDSFEAREALRAIGSDTVCRAVMELMTG